MAKRCYYHSRFEKYKNDIKNTWVRGTIKELLNRSSSRKNFPDFFLINDEKEFYQTNIVNKFNTYFSSIGVDLASAITNTGGKTFEDYLQTPIVQTFAIDLVTEGTVVRIIDNLKPKTSCGHDGLSSYLLNTIQTDISSCLTTLINESLATRLFTNKLKLAKVVPIFKKGDETIFNNYRPISTLPTMSKVFEKVMFEQLHIYLDSLNIYYHGQYGFREKHSTELATL